MQNIIDFIERRPIEFQPFYQQLHAFLSEYEGIKSTIKYGIPFYSKNKLICYTNPQKPSGVEIVFWKAHPMQKSLPLLDKKKRKSMAGITINSLTEENLIVLDGIIREALEIDEL